MPRIFHHKWFEGGSDSILFGEVDGAGMHHHSYDSRANGLRRHFWHLKGHRNVLE
jgi:hypothetical protein